MTYDNFLKSGSHIVKYCKSILYPHGTNYWFPPVCNLKQQNVSHKHSTPFKKSIVNIQIPARFCVELYVIKNRMQEGIENEMY